MNMRVHERETKNRIWLTWEKQRRNHTLSEKLNAELHEVLLDGNKMVRYARSIWRSYRLLKETKPRILFSQNPSIALALWSVLYGKINRLRVIIDAHSAGIFPLEGKYTLLNWVARWIAGNSDMTIVTNSAMARYVELSGGSAFVLPDPFPVLASNESGSFADGKKSVFFICSWAQDEPIAEVVEAARLLGNDINIYISGKAKQNYEKLISALPKNVVLTGYLDEKSYLDMLFKCDLALALTKRENCLLCGVYEAIAAKKTVITTSTTALQEYFGKGAIYTQNSPRFIADAILNAICSRNEQEENARLARNELEQKWEHARQKLESVLCKMEE